MLFGAIILFFLIGVVAIYALIQTGKNYALQAVLIPLILVGTIFAGYSIYILQGTPKNGIPEYEVEIVFVEMQKPWIIFLARQKANDENIDTDPVPKYFKIPYNDTNKKTMNKIMKKMEMGIQVDGQFRKKKVTPNGTQPPTGEFEFDKIKRDGLPPKTTREDGTAYDPNEFEGVDGSIQNRLMERGDFDRMDGALYPGTSPIEDPYDFDPKEFMESSGEEVQAFTNTEIDPKYDYFEAF